MIYERAYLDPATRANNAPLRFVLSSPGEKRDGLTLDQTKWDTRAFIRNPVLLWMHGHDPMRGANPLGRWRNINVTRDGAMTGEAEFDQGDEFAREIERKYRDGYLNAVSVGFILHGRDDGQELLEASAVAVPADPDALAQGRSVVLTSNEYAVLTRRLETLEREHAASVLRSVLTTL